MASPQYSSIEDYLAAQEETKAKTLKAVIDLILTEFPELESKIAWNVPTIHRQGKYVAGIDAFKNHLTFSAFSAQVIADFKDARLQGYKVFKNCFHIPVDWEVDKELIVDLVKARLVELETTPGKI